MLLLYIYNRSFLRFMNMCTYNYVNLWSININLLFYIIGMEVYMLLWNLHLDHQSVTHWSHWEMKWATASLVHSQLTINWMWILPLNLLHSHHQQQQSVSMSSLLISVNIIYLWSFIINMWLQVCWTSQLKKSVLRHTKLMLKERQIFMWVLVLISGNYTFNWLVIHNSKDDASSLSWPLSSFQLSVESKGICLVGK